MTALSLITPTDVRLSKALFPYIYCMIFIALFENVTLGNYFLYPLKLALYKR